MWKFVTASKYTENFKYQFFSKDSPKFKVIMLLHDSIDLVLLEKIHEDEIDENIKNIYTNNFIPDLRQLKTDIFDYNKKITKNNLQILNLSKSILTPLTTLIFSQKYFNFSEIIVKLEIIEEFKSWVNSSKNLERENYQKIIDQIRKNSATNKMTIFKAKCLFFVLNILKNNENENKNIKIYLSQNLQ